MSSDSGPHFDDISDNDWPANDYVRGRASVFPRNKDIAHNEYDEARQLLRDLDRNYFTRHLERGFMTLFPNPDPDGEPFFDYEYPQTDYTDAPWIPPLSHVIHCPPSDYVRPSDGAASHAETDGFPSFSEAGQASDGRPSFSGRHARFSDVRPSARYSSRSQDTDLDNRSFQDSSSRGLSSQGWSYHRCLAHPNLSSTIFAL